LPGGFHGVAAPNRATLVKPATSPTLQKRSTGLKRVVLESALVAMNQMENF